ncbi:MAG: Uncharacterised protein [Bacteroidetes bacterium MED-G17]|nr:MAG: Uncharacterised protein [Bacteroidetes bacterium MED-G17]
MTIKKEDILLPGSLQLIAKKAVEGFIIGLHKSPYHGFSVEFAEHRSYNSGDSAKDIDWKLYARTDKLFVKKYEEETNLRAMIVLDNSSSMHYPKNTKSKINDSILCSAALLYLLEKQNDAFGICFFNQKIDYQTDVKSTKSHLARLFALLEIELIKAQISAKTEISQSLQQIAETNNRGSLVIIFTDFLHNNLDEVFSAIGHLRFNRHEVIVFHLFDNRTEKMFDFDNRPYLFEDLETGEKIKIEPDSVKNSYTQRISNLHRNIKEKCAILKVDYVPLDLTNPVHQVLSKFLQKRGVMKS